MGYSVGTRFLSHYPMLFQFIEIVKYFEGTKVKSVPMGNYEIFQESINYF